MSEICYYARAFSPVVGTRLPRANRISDVSVFRSACHGVMRTAAVHVLCDYFNVSRALRRNVESSPPSPISSRGRAYAGCCQRRRLARGNVPYRDDNRPTGPTDLDASDPSRQPSDDVRAISFIFFTLRFVPRHFYATGRRRDRLSDLGLAGNKIVSPPLQKKKIVGRARHNGLAQWTIERATAGHSGRESTTGDGGGGRSDDRLPSRVQQNRHARGRYNAIFKRLRSVLRFVTKPNRTSCVVRSNFRLELD